MSDDVLDVLIGWLFAAVAAVSAMVGAAGTEPPAAAPAAPAPAAAVVQEAPDLDDTLVPSVAEGLGSLGYLRCDTPTGPGPCFWDGVGGPYVVDTLGGVIPLEANQ